MKDRPNLSNKPLVEAICEVRWQLQNTENALLTDPYFPVLVGRFQLQIEERFAHYTRLPLSGFPVDIPYQPQYQFRKQAETWPIIQLGSGLLTINETSDYEWAKFQDYCEYAIKGLFEASRNADPPLIISSIILRYLDANPLEGTPIREFLKEKLKIGIDIPEALFENSRVSKTSQGFLMKASFESIDPVGQVSLKFTEGQYAGTPAVIWETGVMSESDEIAQKSPSEIMKWLIAAHDITDEWFFQLIDGDLLTRYK